MALTLPTSSNGLYALVDMGSNGIRLSITNLSPPTTRSLPTIYQDRLGISLYDAQYDAAGAKCPIPQDVINEVVFGLRRFKVVCRDFGVGDPSCVKVLATEATRTAENSGAFREQIKEATGWEVDLLSKEDEGRIGAMGVASSFDSVDGLVMDLGGGSTQLTYLHTPDSSSPPQTNPNGSISLPYGAAALTRRLASLHTQHPPLPTPASPPPPTPSSAISTHCFSSLSTTTTNTTIASPPPQTNTNPAFTTARVALATELKSAFQNALSSQLHLPTPLAHQASHGGLTLYLSGGGFRGWGFLCLARHRVQPYPIPIINGFTISRREWLATSEIKDLAALSLGEGEQNDKEGDRGEEVEALRGRGIFRISKRRARQVPAVAFLIECLIDVLPGVKEVRFCQGGVREGWFFERLSAEVRIEDPLVAATRGVAFTHRLRSARSGAMADTVKESEQDEHGLASHVANLLHQSLPPGCAALDRSIPSPYITTSLCTALAHTMYLGSSHPKETRALNALMLPLTGELAGVHGLSHGTRAVLALALKARWEVEGSEVPEPWKGMVEGKLRALLTAQEGWWAEYLGRVAGLVGVVYPSATRSARTMGERIQIQSRWAEGLGKKGLSQGVKVTLRVVGASKSERVGVVGEREESGQTKSTNLEATKLMTSKEAINDAVKHWEKLGKKKNWFAASGGGVAFGVPVRVDVERD